MDVIKFLVNLLTISGLSILLHGVISLSDATSYNDNVDFIYLPFGTMNHIMNFETSRVSGHL